MLGHHLMPRYHDVCYVITKTQQKTAAGARRELDDSRRRLGIDTIDLRQMHAIVSAADVDRFWDQGVIDVFFDAKARGVVRHSGSPRPRADARATRRGGAGDGYDPDAGPRDRSALRELHRARPARCRRAGVRRDRDADDGVQAVLRLERAARAEVTPLPRPAELRGGDPVHVVTADRGAFRRHRDDRANRRERASLPRC